MKKLAVLGAIGISSVDALGATLTDTEKCNVAIESACADVPRGDVSAVLACLPACVPAEARQVLELAVSKPLDLANGLANSEYSAVISEAHLSGGRVDGQGPASKLPTVFAHGMGDSCFNAGMKQITADTGKHIGSYAVCIPTGDNWLSDTINGFLQTMDKSVDVFAEKIRKDPNLKGGFNMVGFSQGNSLIRGYIHKYNDPPVRNVLHVHGTVSGVSGFPQVDPTKSAFGRGISQLCGDLAFNSLVQGILFQANYFRDPRKTNATDYLAHSELALWNNEDASRVNTTFKENFIKVNKYIMVKAMQDTMVFPNEGEHWGHYKDGDSYEAIPMNETRWYKDDLFGLKTVDEAGKIHFETTPGNHLQFTETELFGWVDKYFD